MRLDKLDVKIVLGESIELGHSQEEPNVVLHNWIVSSRTCVTLEAK